MDHSAQSVIADFRQAGFPLGLPFFPKLRVPNMSSIFFIGRLID